MALWAALVVLALGIGLAAYRWALPLWRPGLQDGERFGIDVSRHQGEIDWPAVADAGMTFAYVKASEGGTLVDPLFAANWAASSAAGLDRGAYHFFTLCRSGHEQAANFLAVAPPDEAALAPAVDLELSGNCADRPSRADLHAELADFLDDVENAWGRSAIVYTNDDFDDLYAVRALDRPLWEPRYYRRPAGDLGWTVWQVTSLASVDGVEGGVDLDVLRER